uniref:Uncharacterized protein n=1 Tax=Setaria viridis TaxID=4556 RepID=A0A4U6T1T3_SETVI|nr:hypothetical protein SEVIR_9G253032v2 [Setaria viridis]
MEWWEWVLSAASLSTVYGYVPVSFNEEVSLLHLKFQASSAWSMRW